MKELKEKEKKGEKNQNQVLCSSHIEVPMNGPLKSLNVIVQQQQQNLLNDPHDIIKNQALNGEMNGYSLQIPMTMAQ